MMRKVNNYSIFSNTFKDAKQETGNDHCASKVIGNVYTSKNEIQEIRRRRWNITHPKPVPWYVLDNKGSILIEIKNKSANFISQKIDEYLRLNSICAKFDDANAVANCITSDSLKFQISLYADPIKGSTYVEVMKMEGCGFAFKEQREKMMNMLIAKCCDCYIVSSNNQSKQLSSTTTMTGIKKLRIPQSCLNSCLVPSRNDVQEMVDKANKRINQSKSLKDDTKFILQNLVSSTATSVNAHLMSLAIMENQNSIRDNIFSILKQEHKINDEVSEQICNASLSIFNNGIIAISKENKEKECFDQDMKAFIEELIPLLVEEVANYDKCIFNSCLALKCLESMIKNSKFVLEILRNESTFEIVVAKAKMYGHKEHLKLENAANTFIQLLYQQNDKVPVEMDKTSISEMTARTEEMSFSSIFDSTSMSMIDTNRCEEVSQTQYNPWFEFGRNFNGGSHSN